MERFTPSKEDRFSFGLWTVGNVGRDPFGDRVRERIPPVEIVAKLAELGAYGVNLHDDDLVPFGASATLKDRIVREFKQALDDHGMVVPMATTNLFYHPVFKDGAFSANDPKVRAFALRKTMDAIDLGHELGHFMNELTEGFAIGYAVDVTMNAPAGGKEPLLALMEGLDMGRDHDVFLEGNWRIPGPDCLD